MTLRVVFKRLRRSATWRLSSLMHWACCWGLLIPVLSLRGVLRKPISVRSAHDCVVIMSRDQVRKATFCRKSSILGEYEKYEMAVKCWPVLRGVLASLQYESNAFAAYLTMSRYEQVHDGNAVDSAAQLYAVMRTCGASPESDFDVLRSAQVRAGVDALAALFGQQMVGLIESRLRRWSARNCSIGFAHGDFHSRNIMLEAGGKPRLIDLDCIRMKGIQQLDAVNFVLEAEWSRTGRPWHKNIAPYLRNDVPPAARIALELFRVEFDADLGLVYLLDRVGQEAMNYDFQYLPRHLAEAVEVLERSTHD